MNKIFAGTILFCIASIAIVGVAIAGSAMALGVPDWPLSKKYSESRLVIIGTAVVDGDVISGEPFAIVAVEVVVETTLKGERKKKVILINPEGVTDLRIRCCKAGGRYLMFLQEAKGGYYMSVNGHHGVMEIQPRAARRQ